MTRSLMDLLTTAKMLEQRQINLVSLRENIDTTTATGRCFLSVMGAIHQMERELRAERAAAGRSSAKARGKTGVRPKTDPTKLENARILYENSDKTAAEVCEIAGVGRRKFFPTSLKNAMYQAKLKVFGSNLYKWYVTKSTLAGFLFL